jgi:hypothetical protein
MDRRSCIVPSVPPVEGPSTRVPGNDGQPRLVVVVREASFGSVDKFGGDTASPRIGLDRELDDFTAGGIDDHESYQPGSLVDGDYRVRQIRPQIAFEMLRPANRHERIRNVSPMTVTPGFAPHGSQVWKITVLSRAQLPFAACLTGCHCHTVHRQAHYFEIGHWSSAVRQLQRYGRRRRSRTREPHGHQICARW